MRALDVATFGHAENYEQTMASVFSRFSYASATTIQHLKNSSNNENTTRSTAVWSSVWKKRCLKKGIAKEIEN